MYPAPPATNTRTRFAPSSELLCSFWTSFNAKSDGRSSVEREAVNPARSNSSQAFQGSAERTPAVVDWQAGRDARDWPPLPNILVRRWTVTLLSTTLHGRVSKPLPHSSPTWHEETAKSED